MKILLDTDICIYTINHKRPKMLERVRDYEIGQVGISSITYAELRFGVENSRHVTENIDLLEQFILPLEVVPFGVEAARHYGRVRSALKRKGSMIGSNDLLIAAHALSLDTTLVTNNLREFKRVDGLRLDVWG